MLNIAKILQGRLVTPFFWQVNKSAVPKAGNLSGTISLRKPIRSDCHLHVHSCW